MLGSGRRSWLLGHFAATRSWNSSWQGLLRKLYPKPAACNSLRFSITFFPSSWNKTSGHERIVLPMAWLSSVSQTISIFVTPGWQSFPWRRWAWCILNHCFHKKPLFSACTTVTIIIFYHLLQWCRISCMLSPTRGDQPSPLSKPAGCHSLSKTQPPKGDPVSGVFFSFLIFSVNFQYQ